jgi:pseudaminic acid synthase
VFRRSIFVAEDMKAGDLLTERNVRVVRPGHGLHPKHYKSLLGRKVAVDVAKGTPFTLDLLG